MVDEKQYADELIERYISELRGLEYKAINCAIIDVTNTIKALPYGFYSGKFRIVDHDYYQTVLQILKERL